MKKMTKKNAAHVLGKLHALIQDPDPNLSRDVLKLLNNAFDEAGDTFGTEGQMDPRGDRRG